MTSRWSGVQGLPRRFLEVSLSKLELIVAAVLFPKPSRKFLLDVAGPFRKRSACYH